MKLHTKAFLLSGAFVCAAQLLDFTPLKVLMVGSVIGATLSGILGWALFIAYVTGTEGVGPEEGEQ